MKILLIEDEVKLAEYLRKGLGEASYVVDIAYNGVDGLHMALEGSYDLLVLDAMLPGIDGFSLLTAFRKTKQTPVLMLTARVRVEDRVLGRKTGADDDLVKPFAFSRTERPHPGAATADPWRAGCRRAPRNCVWRTWNQTSYWRKASRRGQRLELTAKEFLLLTLFLRSKGSVFAHLRSLSRCGT